MPIVGKDGKQLTVKIVGRKLSDIGRAANLIVDRQAERFASAHDLRRTFGTRWAKKVKPALLMLLMRHKSIKTTMEYYVDLDAVEIADELWNQHEVKDD